MAPSLKIAACRNPYFSIKDAAPSNWVITQIRAYPSGYIVAARLRTCRSASGDATMPKYRFSMFKAHSDVSSSCFMEGDADEEAREIADALLAQTDFEIAEVWRNAVMIYRVDKANPSSHK